MAAAVAFIAAALVALPARSQTVAGTTRVSVTPSGPVPPGLTSFAVTLDCSDTSNTIAPQQRVVIFGAVGGATDISPGVAYNASTQCRITVTKTGTLNLGLGEIRIFTGGVARAQSAAGLTSVQTPAVPFPTPTNIDVIVVFDQTATPSSLLPTTSTVVPGVTTSSVFVVAAPTTTALINPVIATPTSTTIAAAVPSTTLLAVGATTTTAPAATTTTATTAPAATTTTAPVAADSGDVLVDVSDETVDVPIVGSGSTATTKKKTTATTKKKSTATTRKKSTATTKKKSTATTKASTLTPNRSIVGPATTKAATSTPTTKAATGTTKPRVVFGPTKKA